MNIVEVKQELGYGTLNLNTALDKDGKPTDWWRHWDNAQRIAVSIHKETKQEIDDDKEMGISTLSIQSETREAKGGPYEAKRIVMHKPPETTL